MRKLLVRGAAIAFISAMGFFGSGGHVHFDGMSASLETNTASARPPVPPRETIPGGGSHPCIPAIVDGMIYVCLS